MELQTEGHFVLRKGLLTSGIRYYVNYPYLESAVCGGISDTPENTNERAIHERKVYGASCYAGIVNGGGELHDARA